MPGFEVAVATLAQQNRGGIGLFYPTTVLLEGLGRPFSLNVFSGVFLFLRFSHEKTPMRGWRYLTQKPLIAAT